MRLNLACSLVAILAFTASTSRAQQQEEEQQVQAQPQPTTPKPEPPVENAPPPRFAFGPSIAMGFTTPSALSLFTNIYALLDLRFVVAIRALGPLWVRIEPGTTMSWNNTDQFTLVTVGGSTGVSGVPDKSYTVRVHSIGVRALAAVDLSSRRVVVRGGGTLSYGGAALPDSCSGETRGGAGFGGVLGAGFRPDADRRWEIGAEAGVFIYPYADKCAVNPVERRVNVRLQENPELAFTVGVTWFIF